MKLFQFHPTGDRQITQYGSQGAAENHLVRRYRDAHIVCIELQPGGTLGRHAASGDQLFLIIAGGGQVSGDDGQWFPVDAGTAVLWRSGEIHETRAGPEGLTALVIEGKLDGQPLPLGG